MENAFFGTHLEPAGIIELRDGKQQSNHVTHRRKGAVFSAAPRMMHYLNSVGR